MRKQVAYFGVLTALALIFSYVEHLIPIQFGIPGIKLGLANVMVLIVLYKMGGKEAMLLSVIRVVLSGFMFGNLFAILYSMAGGVFHNMGQLLIAGIVVESFSVFYYLPILVLAGILTGILIGFLANEMLKRLRKI